MTKAELIRKISKRAGVPDSETKFFFELFLRKVAAQLKPGETVKFKGLGYFQLRTGRIRNDSIESELMIFYPLTSEHSDNSDNMIFNIPVTSDSKYNPLDAYFSLSFGRPVIPLTNANSSEYFLPPTGAELRRLSEAKSEKLLHDIEMVDNSFKGNEFLFLNSESSEDTQMEIDWEDVQVKRKSESAMEQDSLTWDFGDLDKEIEEESILDTSTDDNLIQSYEELEKENLNWDFGESAFIEPPAEEIPKEEPEEKKINFEQVKSVTSEFDLKEDELWEFSPEKHHKQTISEEPTEDGFTEVINTKQRFPFETDNSDYTEEELKLIKDNSSDDGLLFEEKPVDIDLNKEPDEVLLPQSAIEEKILKEEREEGTGYGKRKGLGFYLLTAILFLIAIGYYGYTKLIKKPAPKQKVVQYVTPKTAPSDVIIERSYEIPVTYPYLTATKLGDAFYPYNLPKEDSSNQLPEAKPETTIPPKEQNQAPPVINKTEDQQNKLNSESSQKVKEFFFKQGDKYIVQISAWQNKLKAEKHAEDLTKKGFTTEIQSVKLSGSTWYRVRVGYFKTLEEAEKFYNNNR